LSKLFLAGLNFFSSAVYQFHARLTIRAGKDRKEIHKLYPKTADILYRIGTVLQII